MGKQVFWYDICNDYTLSPRTDSPVGRLERLKIEHELGYVYLDEYDEAIYLLSPHAGLTEIDEIECEC